MDIQDVDRRYEEIFSFYTSLEKEIESTDNEQKFKEYSLSEGELLYVQGRLGMDIYHTVI